MVGIINLKVLVCKYLPIDLVKEKKNAIYGSLINLL